MENNKCKAHRWHHLGKLPIARLQTLIQTLRAVYGLWTNTHLYSRAQTFLEFDIPNTWESFININIQDQDHIISYHNVICVRVCIASMKIMGKVRPWSQIPTKISKTTQGLLNHAKDEPTKIRGRHDDSQSSLLPFVETTEPAVAGGEGREVIPLLPFQRGSAPQNSLRIPWQYDVLLVLWSHPLPLLSDGGRV